MRDYGGWSGSSPAWTPSSFLCPTRRAAKPARQALENATAPVVGSPGTLDYMASRVVVVDHPLVGTALVGLRDADTRTDSFRRHARVLSSVLAFSVLEDLPCRDVRVTTPLEPTSGRVLARKVVFVPVLRAGLAMLDAMSDLVPGSEVGFVGLERDEETAIAHNYYEKLPNSLEEAEVVVLDPMLATGGSAVATVDLLKKETAQSIRLTCVVAAPEGIHALHTSHPDVTVFTGVIDRELNERKHILPGLGDFGDRYFGTT
jgi:uracil phosphoribosyltransferase